MKPAIPHMVQRKHYSFENSYKTTLAGDCRIN
jgi:hypothetical protein